MARPLFASLALAAALFLASPLTAQQRITPFAGGGLAMGTGDLGTDTGNGWMAFGGIELPLGSAGLSLGVTAAHARIPYEGEFNEEALVTSITGDLGYTFGLIGNLVAPYVRAGAGLRVDAYEPGNLAGARSTRSDFGFMGSAGLDFDLVGWSIRVGSNYLGGRGSGVWGVFGGLAVPLG